MFPLGDERTRELLFQCTSVWVRPVITLSPRSRVVVVEIFTKIITLLSSFAVATGRRLPAAPVRQVSERVHQLVQLQDDGFGVGQTTQVPFDSGRSGGRQGTDPMGLGVHGRAHVPCGQGGVQSKHFQSTSTDPRAFCGHNKWTQTVAGRGSFLRGPK